MVEECRNEIAVNEACLYEQRRKYGNTNIFESESSKKRRLEKGRDPLRLLAEKNNKY